jgi:protein tyrosine phosphatase (PTP) superfamily phosphohydrolase (DUF442 family)
MASLILPSARQHLVFSVLSCLVASAAASVHWQTFSGTTHFLKRLTPGIFVSGRLSSRHLGYISEAGYASVVSLTDFSSGQSTFQGVEGNWLSTDDEAALLGTYGIAFRGIDADLTQASFDAFTQAMNSIPRPVLVHCENGWKAALFGQLYLTRAGAAAAEDLYSNSVTLGYEYQTNVDAINFVSLIINVSAQLAAPSINLELSRGEASYRDYFWVHRLGNDSWYSVGQVLDSHVNAIKSAGYKSVISFRANGEATNRLKSEPATGAVANGEFSDANGNYNVTAEAEAFANVGIKFYNLPVAGSNAFTGAQFESFLPALEEAARNGPVLAHCASGYRSAVYGVAFLALQDPSVRCLDWAIKETRRVGESVDLLPADQKAINFWKQTLSC